MIYGGAAAIGVLSSAAVYGALRFKDRFIVDDTLDVAAFHGVAGIVGSLSVGFLAVDTGLLYTGSIKQLGIQSLAVVSTLAFALVGSFIIAKVLDLTVGLRLTEQDELVGADSQHI